MLHDISYSLSKLGKFSKLLGPNSAREFRLKSLQQIETVINIVICGNFAYMDSTAGHLHCEKAAGIEESCLLEQSIEKRS